VSKESKENAQDKTSFLIGFTFGEGTRLEAFFCFALAKSFEKASLDQDNRSAAAPQAVLPKKEEAPKQETPDDDLW
jgi:hypothetical protein